MTTQTAIALYILAVTAWVVLCASLHNVASKRKREARRVNLTRLREQFDRQPSEDAYERGRLREKVN